MKNSGKVFSRRVSYRDSLSSWSVRDCARLFVYKSCRCSCK